MTRDEFDGLERELREALDADARRIEPVERLAEIRAAAGDRGGARWWGARHTLRRWVVPVATAASVVVVGGTVYGLAQRPADRVPTPGLSTSSTAGPPPRTATTPPGTPSTSAAHSTTPGPSTGPTTAGTRSGPPSPSSTRAGGTSTVPVVPPVGHSGATNGSTSPAATVRRALPAYFVGSVGGPDGTDGLFRQFVGGAVPEHATPAQLGRAALEAAMGRPAASSADYLQPWAGVRVTGVTVTSGRIEVRLSGPGAGVGLTDEQTRLAVQQLVWTVQAGVGQGSTPVRFSVDDGSTALFGRYPTSRTYDRPAPGSSGEQSDLAPLWIDDPSPGAVVDAGSPVVATGQACTFEGVARWQLRDGSRLVDSGSTTATSGCPTRGTWRIDLDTLAPSRYTLRVFTTSAADGTTVTAEATSQFTVR